MSSNADGSALTWEQVDRELNALARQHNIPSRTWAPFHEALDGLAADHPELEIPTTTEALARAAEEEESE